MALGELERCQRSVFRTLMVVSKHTSTPALTVNNYEICKNDVYQQFLPSVSPRCEQLSDLIDENLTSGIVELHLDVTCHSRALFGVLISVLYSCSCSQFLPIGELFFCCNCKVTRCPDCVSTTPESFKACVRTASRRPSSYKGNCTTRIYSLSETR